MVAAISRRWRSAATDQARRLRQLFARLAQINWIGPFRKAMNLLRGIDWPKLLHRLAVGLGYAAAALFGLTLVAMYCGGIYACYVLAQKTFSPDWKHIADIEAAKVFFPALIAVIGGPLLIWRVVTSQVQAAAARHQAQTAREGHYTDLFTKAVEQLGATREVKTYQEVDDGAGGKRREAVTATEPNLEVRLGAIYALERIAQDSKRDHWPIMEVLCAYVRNRANCGNPTPRPDDVEGTESFSNWLRMFSPPRDDIQAAITVIGRRDSSRIRYEKQKQLRLDFSNATLQKANFESGDFSDTIFDRTHLEWASFHGGTILAGSLFMEAQCDLAHFFDVDLRNVEIDGGSFNHAMFNGSNLQGVSLDGCDLRYTLLRGARVDGVSFFDTDLSLTIIDGPQLENTLGDSETILPPGVSTPTNWPKKKLTSEERVTWIKRSRTEVNHG